MLKEYIAEFAKYKKLGQKTLAQLSDDALNHVPSAEANSMAMIVRLAGLLPGNRVSVIETCQPLPIWTVKGQRIIQPIRFC